MNVSLMQLTIMFFRISEWRQRVGIILIGSDVTLVSAPRQSEYTATDPPKFGLTLFAARSIKCIAIKPSSSPRYAFAANDCSANKPTIIPRLSEHSRMKAAEQSLGYNYLM